MTCFRIPTKFAATSVFLTVTFLFSGTHLSATIFGSVQGVVHDPQHRPIQGAHVTLKAQTSDWTQSQESTDNGAFEFRSVPIGTYTVTVSSAGFVQMQQDVIVQSDTSPVLHFKLAVAGTKEERRRIRNSRGSADGHGHADYDAEPSRHTANPWSGPHQWRGDDHRLRAGYLCGA